MKLYKKFIILIFSLVFASLVTIPPLFAAQRAVIKDIKGKVELKLPGRSWIKATTGSPVTKGTTISTGFNSSAVIDLGASVVEVKALTRMTLEELVEREGTVKTDLFLDVGRVKAEIQTGEGLKHDFTLKSTVSTASVRGTTLEGDGEEWQTESGSVSVSNNIGQTTTVSTGQQTVVTGNSAPSTPQQMLERDTTVITYTTPNAQSGEEEGGATPPSLPESTTATLIITFE